MIGIIWVSLFEASNLVVDRSLNQADGKINLVVNENSRPDHSGGKKRLVGTFRRQEFCKYIRCIILEVSYRSKGHNL